VVARRDSVPARCPEQLADDIVTFVTGPGSARVELRAPGLPPVCVCGHPNPAVVRDHAESLRRFLAAVIRADREAQQRHVGEAGR
jgi:hypothetical protein